MDQYSTIDGIHLRWRDNGRDGPPVLLLHGIGGSLELWSAQFDLAPAGLRLIALDLPGHGLSGFAAAAQGPRELATFVWRFADALGLDQVHLVGNSMGGAIALQMLGSQAARVRSLLLAAAATLGRESPLPFRLMCLPLLGELMARPGSLAVRQQLEAIFSPAYKVPPEIRKAVERNVLRKGNQAAFLATLRRMTDLGGQRQPLVQAARSVLQAVQVPVLLLHGKQDRVLPPVHSQTAQALMPRAQLRILDDCGHTPQLERPDAFSEAMQSLVDRAESETDQARTGD